MFADYYNDITWCWDQLISTRTSTHKLHKFYVYARFEFDLDAFLSVNAKTVYASIRTASSNKNVLLNTRMYMISIPCQAN